MADDIPFILGKRCVGHDGFLSGVMAVRTSNTTRNPIMSCFLAQPTSGALTTRIYHSCEIQFLLLWISKIF